VLVIASAAAQAPGSAAQPTHHECSMQSLQALTSETIYQRQPLSSAADGKGASASGTVSDQRFARIRDARFERSGRLVEMIVEMPDDATNSNAVRRVLPAEAATWDDATKRWITTEANLKFAELSEVPKPELAADPKALATDPKAADPNKGKKGQTMLASELLLANIKIAPMQQVVAADPAGEPSLTKKPADAGAPKETPKETRSETRSSAILWFAPSERMLSFAVVPQGTRHMPLPWSLLRVANQAGELQLTTDSNPARFADAPTCKDAMEQPSQELRQRCYEHYGVPCPKWDRPAGEGSGEGEHHQDPLTKRDGKSQDR
jgi:hypothetical protein